MATMAKTAATYWEIRYRERTAGISGFPAKDIVEGERWEGYVRSVGTRGFATFEAARAWCIDSKQFADACKRLDAR